MTVPSTEAFRPLRLGKGSWSVDLRWVSALEVEYFEEILILVLHRGVVSSDV